MNRIEEKFKQLKEKNEKAFITYMTAGLPDMERCKKIIEVQAGAGTDIIELGIPFSDPTADGPVIQNASFRAIQKGVNVRKVFQMVKELRETCQVPIVFMMYYNTILHYGIEKFVIQCIEAGVDGLIIPDLPFEEQEELNTFLQQEDAPILIQLVAPVSGKRIPMLLKNARGFVYCVSAMGVTGQGGSFYKNLEDYLKNVKTVSKVPVMMGFGIRTAKDVQALKETIDGCIVGSAFIQLMEKNNYDISVIEEYCSTFKRELNEK